MPTVIKSFKCIICNLNLYILIADMMALIQNVQLRTQMHGQYHTSQIIAFSSGRMITPKEEEGDLVMAWYRMTPKNDFVNIKGKKTTSTKFAPV